MNVVLSETHAACRMSCVTTITVYLPHDADEVFYPGYGPRVQSRALRADRVVDGLFRQVFGLTTVDHACSLRPVAGPE